MQFAAILHQGHGVAASLWIMLRYFTILANLLVAAAFGGLAAAGALRPPWLLAGATLSILLVGVVYGLLLHGLVELSGGSQVANVLLHMASPVLAPLCWLAFAPKGRLRPRDALIWFAFPAAYLAYALVRGAGEGFYAYPFIDLAKLGWGRVALNCAVIGAGFLLAGWGVVRLDGALAGARGLRAPGPRS